MKTTNRVSLYILLFCLTITKLSAQTPAAEHPETYISLLKGKKIGLVANHTTMVVDRHLLDVLLDSSIVVVKVYAPEHGFRGTVEAGETVKHTIDSKTGIPIISLYGSNKKPTTKQLSGVDCVVFDMQDVGVRFYTYLSTMHYVMEACAENNIPLIVLDRPNPNGFYVDGPILDTAYKSFVGMHPIPVVHGMTLGELAQMINGEGWLANHEKCALTVVRCHDYTHQSRYRLPVKPSPNLPNMQAVYLYPSLCLFEGTVLSIGRGTEFPFQVFGHPAYKSIKKYSFSFTPKTLKAMPKPLLDGQLCYGIDLREENTDKIIANGIYLQWLIDAYRNFKQPDKFFNNYFNTLSGGNNLRQQIEKGKTAAEIHASWKSELDAFKSLRNKYLLYPE